jgi:hypothetical protein
MAIGRPRGKNGKVPLYVYDPAVGKKRYIGSFDTVQDARKAERLAKRRFGTPAPIDADVPGWRQILIPDELSECERAVAAGEQLVYFVQGIDGGPIKIGIAVDPDERLRELQCFSPLRLAIRRVMPGGQAKEAEIHARFRHERLWGEWFEPEFEVVEFARAKHLFGRDGAKLPVDRLRAERAAWRKRTEELETLITTVQRELADALRLRMIDVDEVEAA